MIFRPCLQHRKTPLHFFSSAYYSPLNIKTRIISESTAYEWTSKPGLIRYYYHLNKRPDTSADVLSLGFITPLDDAVLIRVDSGAASNFNDYLEVELVSGFRSLSCCTFAILHCSYIQEWFLGDS